MKEIYIRYPVTKKIEVTDEMYDLIYKETIGLYPAIDEIDYRDYLWRKVEELTDDEDMCELDFIRTHDGLPMAEFCV